MTTQSQEPNLLARWLLAVRPKTLGAAVGPVLAGCGVALAAGSFRLLPALAALWAAVLIQIGTNLVNDVVDYAKGADNEGRLGPLRVTQAGLLSPGQVWAGVAVSFGLAGLAGVYLALVGGWPVLAIGLASILAGIAYTAGPYPLAYNGLGDLFVLLFFGFVAVVGTVFVAAGFVPPAAWPAAAGVGALVVNILVVNNIRDIDSDREAGRRNIPVLYGRQVAELEFLLMLLLAIAAPLVMAALGDWGALLALAALPNAVRIYRALRVGTQGRALNPLLGQSARLVSWYGGLMLLGLIGQAVISSLF